MSQRVTFSMDRELLGIAYGALEGVIQAYRVLDKQDDQQRAFAVLLKKAVAEMKAGYASRADAGRGEETE